MQKLTGGKDEKNDVVVDKKKLTGGMDEKICGGKMLLPPHNLA